MSDQKKIEMDVDLTVAGGVIMDGGVAEAQALTGVVQPPPQDDRGPAPARWQVILSGPSIDEAQEQRVSEALWPLLRNDDDPEIDYANATFTYLEGGNMLPDEEGGDDGSGG